jgi:hypothetical protein
LDAVCGNDERLRAEVEDLLRHDDVAGKFMESGALAEAPTCDPSEQHGVVIGRYKLIEQIGEH